MRKIHTTTLAATLLAVLTSSAYAANEDIGKAVIETIKPQLIQEVKQEYSTDLANKADQSEVNALKEKVETNEESIKSLIQNMGTLKGDLEDKASQTYAEYLESTIDVAYENVQTLFDVTNEHETKLDALAAATAETAAGVAVVNNKVKELDEDIQDLVDNIYGDQEDSLVSVVNKNSERIGALENVSNEHETKLDALAAATAGTAAAVAQVNQDIKRVESLIPTDQNLEPIREDLRQTKAKVQEQFDKANLDITKVDAKTKANALKIVDLDNKLNETNEEVAKKASTDDLEAVKVDVAAKATKEALAETNKEVAKKADKSYVDEGLAKKADKSYVDEGLAKKADKSYVDEGLAENAKNIAENTKSIKKNAKDIATNTVSIKNNSVRIDKLDQRVTKLDKKLERGLSQQAALSGLFQPYNVGKVNVTAAVGGYKSRTAIAVGAGYRFNDKVAAKAGVSFSTDGGSGSYNVGVNYEF